MKTANEAFERLRFSWRQFWLEVARAIIADDAWVVDRFGPRSGRCQINPLWALEWAAEQSAAECSEFVSWYMFHDLEDAEEEYPEFYIFHINKDGGL